MKPSAILSMLTAFAVHTPAPDAPTPTLTVGNNAARSGWQVYPPGQSLENLSPEVMERLELKARNAELEAKLEARDGKVLFLAGFFCSSGLCNNAPTNEFQMVDGTKKNLGLACNTIFYHGGDLGCHITLYPTENEQPDPKEFRQFLTNNNQKSKEVAFPQASGQPLVRSVGYFCS